MPSRRAQSLGGEPAEAQAAAAKQRTNTIALARLAGIRIDSLVGFGRVLGGHPMNNL